jgi:hypothetical protein
MTDDLEVKHGDEFNILAPASEKVYRKTISFLLYLAYLSCCDPISLITRLGDCCLLEIARCLRQDATF